MELIASFAPAVAQAGATGITRKFELEKKLKDNALGQKLVVAITTIGTILAAAFTVNNIKNVVGALGGKPLDFAVFAGQAASVLGVVAVAAQVFSCGSTLYTAIRDVTKNRGLGDTVIRPRARQFWAPKRERLGQWGANLKERVRLEGEDEGVQKVIGPVRRAAYGALGSLCAKLGAARIDARGELDEETLKKAPLTETERLKLKHSKTYSTRCTNAAKTSNKDAHQRYSQEAERCHEAKGTILSQKCIQDATDKRDEEERYKAFNKRTITIITTLASVAVSAVVATVFTGGILPLIVLGVQAVALMVLIGAHAYDISKGHHKNPALQDLAV